MANKTELGYGEESDKAAMKANDDLAKQLKAELQAMKEAAKAGKK